MKKSIFEGVGTALITPFKNDKVDYISLEILLKKQAMANVSAIIVLGTTGEACTVASKKVREKIITLAKRVCPRQKIIVGCGSNNTKVARQYLLQAKKLGADGALVVTPYYNKCTQSGLVEHYRAVCRDIDLPVIAYNVPSRTGMNIEPSTLKELEKIKNIVGIKEASGNISQALDFFASSSLDIYSGEDALNAIFMAMGAKGTISVASNVVPRECVEIYRKIKQGDFGSAFDLQKKMHGLIRALFLEVNPIPVKALLAHLGLCKNELRLPLSQMGETKFETLRQEYVRFLAGQNESL